jgi:hypothetical protein
VSAKQQLLHLDRRLLGVPPRPVGVLFGWKVGFKDRFQHHRCPEVFFRRSTPQITNPGGLWDESKNFYPRLGGIPHVGLREWRWPRAGRIKF